MGPPDRGIADMKVGQEPSSLQRRRAEGLEEPETTALTGNDGGSEGAPADLLEDA